MLYPIRFSPIYKDIIWGGTDIKRRFKRETPLERVAESWELSCRGDGMGIVENGELKGRSFQNLIDEYGKRLLGNRTMNTYGSSFPLLVKLIDAADRLSVQVHPTDEYARMEGEPNGKNEMWYIIDAKKDAKLVYGLRPNVTKRDFTDAVSQNRVPETLNEAPVKAGDFFFIPAGTVHAILDGILIAEIQQNSNTTYRIYDWGRVDAEGRGRELHTQKALNVINFGPPPGNRTIERVDCGGYIKKRLHKSDFFFLEEIDVTGGYSDRTDGGAFKAVMLIDGGGVMEYENGATEVSAGETYLIPAEMGKFELKGEMKALLTGV